MKFFLGDTFLLRNFFSFSEVALAVVGKKNGVAEKTKQSENILRIAFFLQLPLHIHEEALCAKSLEWIT